MIAEKSKWSEQRVITLLTMSIVIPVLFPPSVDEEAGCDESTTVESRISGHLSVNLATMFPTIAALLQEYELIHKVTQVKYKEC